MTIYLLRIRTAGIDLRIGRLWRPKRRAVRPIAQGVAWRPVAPLVLTMDTRLAELEAEAHLIVMTATEHRRRQALLAKPRSEMTNAELRETWQYWKQRAIANPHSGAEIEMQKVEFDMKGWPY